MKGSCLKSYIRSGRLLVQAYFSLIFTHLFLAGILWPLSVWFPFLRLDCISFSRLSNTVTTEMANLKTEFEPLECFDKLVHTPWRTNCFIAEASPEFSHLTKLFVEVLLGGNLSDSLTVVPWRPWSISDGDGQPPVLGWILSLFICV